MAIWLNSKPTQDRRTSVRDDTHRHCEEQGGVAIWLRSKPTQDRRTSVRDDHTPSLRGTM